MLLASVSPGINWLGTGDSGAPNRKIEGIVVPDHSSSAEEFAASELNYYLRRMSDKDFPIWAESNRQRLRGRVILVGRTEPGNSRAAAWKLGEETLLIDTQSQEDIVITGGNDTAILFAAYSFLKKLGCRWLKPGIDGEYIPLTRKLEIPVFRSISSPDFAVRGWMGFPQYGLGGRSQIINANEKELQIWGIRNGLNSMSISPVADLGERWGHGYVQRMGHTLSTFIPSGDATAPKVQTSAGSVQPAQGGQSDVAPELYQAHPEYYPVLSGVRVWKHSEGRPVQACLSNPNVVDMVAKGVMGYLRMHPTTKRFNVSHNDEPTYWCECDNCRALDGAESKWTQNNLVDSIADASPAGPGPMSRRWIWFIDQVAKMVRQEFPDTFLSFYAYGSTVAPPKSGKWELERNVMVEYANAAICGRHSFEDESCPHNVVFGNWLAGWRASRQPVVIYDYEPYPGRFMFLDLPVFWYRGMAHYVRFLKNAGVVGFAGEEQQMWSGSALWCYLKANLLWDSESDVDALMVDFCNYYYGSAGATMVKYYNLLDSVTQQHPGHLTFSVKTRMSATLELAANETFEAITEEVLAQGLRLLEAALLQAKADPSRSHVIEAKISFLALKAKVYQDGSLMHDPGKSETALRCIAGILRENSIPIGLSNALQKQIGSLSNSGR
jgi:hypothetical protein